jgi:hypothetical protein
MKNKELLKLLIKLNGITQYSWSSVYNIVKAMPKTKILESEWCDDYKKDKTYYPLNLSKIDTWSTFDNSTCIILRYYVSNNKLICDVKINNGDSFDGYFRSERFTAKIQLPIGFIKNLSDSIEYKLQSHLDGEYDDYLKKKENEWKNKLRAEILININ